MTTTAAPLYREDLCLFRHDDGLPSQGFFFISTTNMQEKGPNDGLFCRLGPKYVFFFLLFLSTNLCLF